MLVLTDVKTSHRMEGTIDPRNQRVVLIAEFTLTPRATQRPARHALGAQADRMENGVERSMDEAYHAALAKLLEQVAQEVQAACEP